VENEHKEQDEDEYEDEDDGKEPWTIDQGVIVNTSTANVDNMPHNESTVLPAHGQ